MMPQPCTSRPPATYWRDTKQTRSARAGSRWNAVSRRSRDMSLPAQARFLRVMEEREFQRLDRARPATVEVQQVAGGQEAGAYAATALRWASPLRSRVARQLNVTIAGPKCQAGNVMVTVVPT